MFLVPASILFVAIGIARTEWLKAALISLVGTGVGCLWSYRIISWPDLTGPDQATALGLALIFAATAFVSMIVHLVRAIMGYDENAVQITP
jgi:hypothetical protein